MMTQVSPHWLLAAAAIVFLTGCGILAFRPDRWRPALAVSFVGMVMVVALMMGARP